MKNRWRAGTSGRSHDRLCQPGSARLPRSSSDRRRALNACELSSSSLEDQPAAPASSDCKYAKTSSPRPSRTSCSAVLPLKADRASSRNHLAALFDSPDRSVAARSTRVVSDEGALSAGSFAMADEALGGMPGLQREGERHGAHECEKRPPKKVPTRRRRINGLDVGPSRVHGQIAGATVRGGLLDCQGRQSSGRWCWQGPVALSPRDGLSRRARERLCTEAKRFGRKLHKAVLDGGLQVASYGWRRCIRLPVDRFR